MGEITVGLLTGLLFGLGLCLSGMAVAGNWNPTLLFVMAGGVSVAFIGYRIVLGRKHPLWSKSFQLPAATAVDAPLISGAVIFGIGWGLAGYCPGPALVSLASGRPQVLVFVVAMLAGMVFVRWMRARPRATIAAAKGEA